MCCCHDGIECHPRGETGRECGAPRTHLPRAYECTQGEVVLDQRGPRKGAVERGRDRRVGESQRPFGMAILFVAQESGRARQADARQHVSDRALMYDLGDG